MAFASAFGLLALFSLISLLVGTDRRPADPRDDLLVLMNIARH